jgi:hypothetical protein
MVFVSEACFFLLKMRGIGQQDVSQIDGRWSGIYRALETLRNEPRQVSGVIDMRMREDDGIDGSWINWRSLPISQSQIFRTLKHAAVQQNAPIICLKKEF